MTKVTWLGDGSGAETNEWNGQTFKKGEAVEVKDEAMVAKAKGNRFYKVAGDKSETIEDNPLQPVLPGREDDRVENMAFVDAERLRAHAENAKEVSEAHDELVQTRTRRGRPPKNKAA